MIKSMGNIIMKRIIVFCIFLLTGSLFVQGVNALDGIFIGVGAEANANTREGVAAGGGLSFGFDLNRQFTLGFKAVYSNNFDTVANVEPAAFFRMYLFSGLFAQVEAGGSFFFEDNEVYPAPYGGLTAGWQFLLGEKFFLEPFARGGYPIAWSVGVNFGMRVASNIRAASDGQGSR
jgi:hypothetical protein